MAVDLISFLEPIGRGGYGCAMCGHSLRATDKAIDCADCGAIICESCVRSGAFPSEHICDEEELEI